jgi:uncharacterized protein
LRAKDSPYTVGLREIPSDGLHKKIDLSGDFARATLAETEADLESARLVADVTVTKSGDEVLARGSIDGEVTLPCSRCVGSARVTVSAPFAVLFLPRDADVPDAAAEDAEAPDVIPYEDDQVDLGDMLREEILLALPYAPLCKEACKGLCPNCGKDLNEGACGCSTAPVDDRFAALRNLKV